MNPTEQSDPTLEIIWQFVRGDMAPAEFEKWVYAAPELEGRLGHDLYLDAISLDYSRKKAVYEIRTSLKSYARNASNLRCECVTLRDLTDVGMGEGDDIVLRTLELRARRGAPLWWLSGYQCIECDQWWLVASESRQNDVYFLKRLSLEQGQQILEKQQWPKDFDSFEHLLRLGAQRGHRWSFVDPLDSSLVWTTIDLARERPGINVSELAKLLNLDLPVAEQIAKTAVRDEGVVINFESKDTG